MNIILGQQNLKDIEDRYLLLELDTVIMPGGHEPVTAYCLIEKIGLADIMGLQKYMELHANVMKEYRRRHWHYCLDALDHLVGRWNGELDSFYLELRNRVQNLQTQELPEHWDGVVRLAG